MQCPRIVQEIRTSTREAWTVLNL